MRTRRKFPTVCHPGRPHVALGLCGPCRQYWGKATKHDLYDDRALHLRGIVSGHTERQTEVAIQWRVETIEENRRSPDRYAKGRNKSLKDRYGITLDQYDEMLVAQNSVCAICEGPPKTKPLYVDHCHTTGRIRGLLCAGCNTKMALIDDGPEVMRKFIEYSQEKK